MKKLIIGLVSLLVLLLGCGNGEENEFTSDPNNHTLTVWAWDGNFNIPMIEKGAELYRENVDPEFQIEVVEIGQNDMNQKLQTIWSSGSSEGLPDIALRNSERIQTDVFSYGDVYLGLNEYITFSDFEDAPVSEMTVNETTYGIPYNGGPSALMYRKDIFEKAGYNNEDLRNLTWDEFIVIAEDVTSKTGVKAYSTDVANWVNPPLLDMSMTSINQWFPTDPSTSNMAENEDIVKAFEQMVKISNSSASMNTENNWGTMVSAVNDGDVASFAGPIWFLPIIESATDQNDKWALAEYPRIGTIDSSVNAANKGSGAWTISSSSKDQELAVDFLNYITSDVSYYEYMATDFYVVPYYKPALESDVFQTTTSPSFGEQPIFPIFIESQQQLEYADKGLYTQEYLDAIKAKTPDMINGKCTVEECLGEIDEQVKTQQ